VKLFEEKLWVAIGMTLFFGVIILTFFISNNYSVNTEYGVAYRKHDGLKRSIYWIPCDPLTDEPDFNLCADDRVYSHHYCRPTFEVEGKNIEKYLLEELNAKLEPTEENGYINVRFIINCEGKAGRFRLESMNKEYGEYNFPQITHEINQTLKELPNWQPGNVEGKHYDVFYYLNFKIEQGLITDIKS